MSSSAYISLSPVSVPWGVLRSASVPYWGWNSSGRLKTTQPAIPPGLPAEMQGPTDCTTGSHSLPWSGDVGVKGVVEGQLLFSFFLFPSGLSHPPPPSITASVLVAQSCLTLCAHMDCSPPGPSVHGILQARILEWVAMLFSRESSRPRDLIQVSHIAGRFFTV